MNQCAFQDLEGGLNRGIDDLWILFEFKSFALADDLTYHLAPLLRYELVTQHV